MRISGDFAGPKDVMADKKKEAQGGPEGGNKTPDQRAGKKPVAPEAAGEAAPRMKSTKIPKLSKKNKSRLPRRVKKARQKAADAGSAGG